jgi:hypothetical protein
VAEWVGGDGGHRFGQPQPPNTRGCRRRLIARAGSYRTKSQRMG